MAMPQILRTFRWHSRWGSSDRHDSQLNARLDGIPCRGSLPIRLYDSRKYDRFPNRALISPFVEINISNYHGDGITTTFIAFRILRSLEGFLCNVINILLVLVQLKLYHFLQNVAALKKEYSTNLFISLQHIMLLIRNKKSFISIFPATFFSLHVLNNATKVFASTMNHVELSSKDKIRDKVHSPRFLSRVGVASVALPTSEP